MSSTTIRVTPTARGNFSKLRKYKNGNNVEKYETPANSIHKGVTFIGNTTWSNTIHPAISPYILAELSAAKTPEQKQVVIDKYNNAQEHYARIRPKMTDLSTVSYDQDIADYQNSINEKFSFVNTKGIANGIDKGRYNYLAEKKFATGDRPGSWTADGYGGAQTYDRTTLGAEGDWDEDSQEFNDWQSKLNELDTETYLDQKDKVYKFRLKTSNQTPTSDKAATPEQDLAAQDDPSKQGASHVEQDNHTEQPKDEIPAALTFNKDIPGFDAPRYLGHLPLTANLINDLRTNLRSFNQEVKKKFPLQEAPYQQAIVTNNYAGRQIRSGIAANIRARANQNLSSNADYNLALQQNAENQANQLEEQNALDQTQRFNETTKNVNAVANLNNQTGTAVANANAQQNAAAYNNILAARQRLYKANNASLNSYNANMYTSPGNWLQNYRLEKARYDRALNDYNYSKQATELYKTSGLEALEGDNGIYSSNAFASLIRELENDTNVTGILDSEGKISPELVKTWIENNPDDERVKRLQTNFQNEYNRAYNSYRNRLEEIASKRTLNNLSIKSTESNQGTRWGDILRERRNKPNPLYQKKGGRAARLIEYMEHYRKAQKDVADRNTETQKILWKQLDRDLNLIDKETLLLLKAAFK